jgi:heme-degrading monooxygenase HmoA
VGEDEAFIGGWERAREFLSTQEGYLSARLHRSISQTADFRYVNVALWESEEAFRAATSRPEFSNARTSDNGGMWVPKTMSRHATGAYS